MTEIEDRLKAMLRGRLPESERLELEAWFLMSSEAPGPESRDALERIEQEVLDAWMAGELSPPEAVNVLGWHSAQRIGALWQQIWVRESVLGARASPWVM